MGGVGSRASRVAFGIPGGPGALPTGELARRKVAPAVENRGHSSCTHRRLLGGGVLLCDGRLIWFEIREKKLFILLILERGRRSGAERETLI